MIKLETLSASPTFPVVFRVKASISSTAWVAYLYIIRNSKASEPGTSLWGSKLWPYSRWKMLWAACKTPSRFPRHEVEQAALLVNDQRHLLASLRQLLMWRQAKETKRLMVAVARRRLSCSAAIVHALISWPERYKPSQSFVWVQSADIGLGIWGNICLYPVTLFARTTSHSQKNMATDRHAVAPSCQSQNSVSQILLQCKFGIPIVWIYGLISLFQIVDWSAENSPWDCHHACR